MPTQNNPTRNIFLVQVLELLEGRRGRGSLRFERSVEVLEVVIVKPATVTLGIELGDFNGRTQVCGIASVTTLFLLFLCFSAVCPILAEFFSA
jgi:hypothetical protein